MATNVRNIVIAVGAIVILSVVAFAWQSSVIESSPELESEPPIIDIEEQTPIPSVPPIEIQPQVVRVFFSNSEQDPEMLYCERVYPTSRRIQKTPAIARAALEELLAGPSEDEIARGFATSINSGVKIQSLSIVDGIASVDFSSELGHQIGGACAVTAIRAQITETLKQFPAVNEVIISIDGQTEDILQP